MKPEVVVVSRARIKPSSPTPEHLRHYDLSFIDQMSPPLYMPLVLYYPRPTLTELISPADREPISNQLKKSLSDSLTKFYPLAGRLKDNLYVECNDEGAEYVEAMVKCKISEVIHSVNASDLINLTPQPCLGEHDGDEFLLTVQINFFECGGIAIGLRMSHKLADALSFFTFIRSWAAINSAHGDQLKDGEIRGVSRTPKGGIDPQFDAAKLFPPMRNLPDRYSQGVDVIRKDGEKIISKMFVFEASKIVALKHKYASATVNDNDSNDEQPPPRPPTRIEALSAFMWTRLWAATRRVDHNPVYLAIHTINLRPRMDPPLPEYSFGNFCWLVTSVPPIPTTVSENKGGGGREELAVVREIRKAIRKIDSEYMKKILEEGVDKAILRPMKEIESKSREGEMVTLDFSSLCRFGIYELADFGWGRPAWANPIGDFTKNLVVFMDSPAGDAGVEAWVCLESEDMVRFEAELNTSFLARDASELSV